MSWHAVRGCCKVQHEGGVPGLLCGRCARRSHSLEPRMRTTLRVAPSGFISWGGVDLMRCAGGGMLQGRDLWAVAARSSLLSVGRGTGIESGPCNRLALRCRVELWPNGCLQAVVGTLGKGCIFGWQAAHAPCQQASHTHLVAVVRSTCCREHSSDCWFTLRVRQRALFEVGCLVQQSVLLQHGNAFVLIGWLFAGGRQRDPGNGHGWASCFAPWRHYGYL
jgi:hypothetical protein